MRLNKNPQKIWGVLNNMKTIILASNRRVNITLSNVAQALIVGGVALTIAGAHAPGNRKIEDQWCAASSGKKKGHPLKMRDARSVESPSEACRYCGGISFGFRCSS